MADEAFALSPISARAAEPSEADYDAIREAFMETSRGRWFLGEYAKRNRNADTKMVLDAVARIEGTLAEQKRPVRDPLLDEALAAFRSALSEARAAADTALADLALDQNLAPVRKGARVIREIAWRLREIGADGRICDLIDSQVGAIEGAAGKFVPADLAATFSAAFDRVEARFEARVAAFEAGGEVSDAPVAATAPSERLDERAAEAVSPAPAETEIEAQIIEPAVADEAAAAVEAASEPADTFDASDEAMLDMVAMEMAAPDTDAAYEEPVEEMADGETEGHQEAPATGLTAAMPAAPVQPAAPSKAVSHDTSLGIDDLEITFVTDTAPNDAPAAPLSIAPVAAVPIEAAPIEVAVEAEGSLGSSLIANGIVPRPRAPRPDPLAPIRRMTQTEKIAFFS